MQRRRYPARSSRSGFAALMRREAVRTLCATTLTGLAHVLLAVLAPLACVPALGQLAAPTAETVAPVARTTDMIEVAFGDGHGLRPALPENRRDGLDQRPAGGFGHPRAADGPNPNTSNHFEVRASNTTSGVAGRARSPLRPGLGAIRLCAAMLRCGPVSVRCLRGAGPERGLPLARRISDRPRSTRERRVAAQYGTR